MCTHTQNVTVFFVALNVLTHSSKNNVQKIDRNRLTARNKNNKAEQRYINTV